MTDVAQFYSTDYWIAQAQTGEFYARANRPRFAPYCHPDATVLDFGCGGGWLLRDLPARARIGVEVNPQAHQTLALSGIAPHTSFATVPSASVDLVISNHALEHVAAPLEVLREVWRVLRPGGFAVFVVPSETILSRFKTHDRDQHLYTWSPANLGNLFRAASFRVHSSKPLFSKFPPKAQTLQRLVGWPAFQGLSRLWGLASWHLFQTKIVAQKQASQS